jgi:Respiratory-chain NADH dehydrogenase 24 Kd subunit.
MAIEIKKEMEDKFRELKAVIDEYRDIEGPLMPIMHKAQEIFGYLPLEVQNFIAEELNIPLTDVYGVATFYTHFTLKPQGKYTINVCLGTACYVKGAQKILDKLKEELKIEEGDTTPDGRFTIDATRCLGACGLAPVMMINGEVYGRLVPEDIPKILKRYMND